MRPPVTIADTVESIFMRTPEWLSIDGYASGRATNQQSSLVTGLQQKTIDTAASSIDEFLALAGKLLE